VILFSLDINDVLCWDKQWECMKEIGIEANTRQDVPVFVALKNMNPIAHVMSVF